MTTEEIAELKQYLGEWKAFIEGNTMCFDWAEGEEKALKRIIEILEAQKPEITEAQIVAYCQERGFTIITNEAHQDLISGRYDKKKESGK